MSKDKVRFSNNIQIRNRKASYEYELVEKVEAGMILKGTEIKSLREGKVSIQEAYCFFRNKDLFVKSMNISSYSQASFEHHDMTRDRKLLLKKRELEKFKSKMDEKGLTIIPTKIYITNRGLAKLEIALAKGKKIHDKRDSIKKKDQKRELERMRI